MLKLAAYLRKSLDEKGKQLYSISYQKEEIKKAAKEFGFKVKFFEERKSGTDPNRPVFLRVLKEIEEGKYDGLAAYSLDRLSRNMVDSGRLFEMFIRGNAGKLFIVQYKNVDWKSYEGGMLFVAHMMGAIFEVLGTQMRTLTAMQYLAEQGRHLGPLPYGYVRIKRRGNERIEVVPEEAEKIKEIFALRIAKGYGKRRISSIVGLSADRVRSILENERYTGYMVVNGEVVKLELPQIIPPEIFCKVNPKSELCKLIGGKSPLGKNGV